MVWIGPGPDLGLNSSLRASAGLGLTNFCGPGPWAQIIGPCRALIYTSQNLITFTIFSDHLNNLFRLSCKLCLSVSFVTRYVIFQVIYILYIYNMSKYYNIIYIFLVFYAYMLTLLSEINIYIYIYIYIYI